MVPQRNYSFHSQPVPGARFSTSVRHSPIPELRAATRGSGSTVTWKGQTDLGQILVKSNIVLLVKTIYHHLPILKGVCETPLFFHQPKGKGQILVKSLPALIASNVLTSLQTSLELSKWNTAVGGSRAMEVPKLAGWFQMENPSPKNGWWLGVSPWLWKPPYSNQGHLFWWSKIVKAEKTVETFKEPTMTTFCSLNKNWRIHLIFHGDRYATTARGNLTIFDNPQ